MAKQVSNVFIRLGIENFEGIDKLKSAFRELDKSIGPTSKSIDAAIAAVKSYANESTRSEQLIRGQIEAFKGLRSQVDVSGSSYAELTTEINQLQAELRGSTDAVERQRQALLSNFNQNERNVRTIREHVRALTELQTQARANSSAFITLGANVEAAATRLANAQNVISTLRAALTRGLPATGAGAQRRMTELDEGIRAQKAIIDEIDLRVPAERRLASVIRERAEAEEILNRSLVDRRQLAFQESARTGREDARIAAAAFSNAPVGGTGFLSIENIGRRIGDVPNTIAGINQELGEMRERLSNAALEGRDFIAVLDYIDDLNNRLRLATTEFQTPRQQARAAVQARLDAQREQLRQGGFGAFSADINGRGFKAKQQRTTVSDVKEAFASIAAAQETMESAVRDATARTLQQELNAGQLIEEGDQRAHAAYMQRKQQEADAGERWFKEELARLDILSQQRKAAASAMGLGGRELSPLYQRITGLATAGVAQQQQFMGRSATAVYTDVVNAFNAGSRPVDLKNKSTYIGDSIAQGVSEGAKDSPAILSGARYFAHKVLVTYKREIASELSRYGDILFGGPGAAFNLARADVATGRQKLGVADTAIGLRSPGGFPIEGMMGPSSPLGGGPRPPTPPSNGGGFDKLNADITKFGALNRRSIDDLQGLKATLDQVHAGLSPLDADYKKINRAIEQQNLLIDKQLAKRQQGGGRGLSGRQLAQIGGAAISGGIFGGAEGFLGGVAGGIFGGVGGSFAGAAVGAQVGMLRQQLAGTAEYAAQIGKLQIALRGVAGTQDNYNQAINAAAAATRDLNIPQMEATQGITRLSAAVLGAGGTMGDANFAFRAISESIKATGGNAEQVDGALLALTQVFSKGKVSAEELNQIAERLPGTFTLFAQAAGKSGPELQKALQQGEVGLNDLMKFLELASSKYGQSALDIANSSEEAGARMKITFDQMRLEVGKALQPIGAELQKTFAVFAKDITPTVIAAAQGIASALKTIMDNAEAIGTIAKLGAAFFATKLAIQGFVAMRGALGVMSLAIQSFFGNITAQAAMAGQQIKRFAASIAAPLIISVGIVGVESVISDMRRVEEARKSAEGSGKATQGDEFIAQAGGDTLNSRDLARLLRENDARFNIVLDDRRKARQEAAARNLSLNDARAIVKNPTGYPLREIEVASQLVNVENQLLTLQSRRAAILKQIQTAKPPAPLPNPTAAGGTGKTAEEKAAEQLAETERRLAEEGIKIEMDGQFKAFTYGIELDRRRYELRKQLQDEATANEIEGLQGGARTVAQAFATYRSKIAELDRNLALAQENVSIERERLRTSQAVAAVTAGGAASGRNYANVGGTGLPGGRQMLHGIPGYAGYDAEHATPTNIHYHFAGKNPQETLAVAQYLKSKGYQISEFGGMGQRVGEHEEGSQHYRRNAFDIGGASLGSSDAQIQAGLKTVHALINDFLASAMGSTSTGYIGSAGTTGRGRSRLLRDQKAEGKADVAGLDVSKAEKLQALEEANAKDLRLQIEKALTLELTKAYRASTAELQLAYDLEVKRTQLQKSGASTTAIDNELKLFELRRRNAEETARIRLEVTDPDEQQKQITVVNDALAKEVELRQKIFDLTEATANSVGFREGAQRYVESIGTLREATAGLAQQGFKGIEDSIVSLATTGTANFAQFATSLLSDMARIIIQQFVVKQLAEAIGNLFGGPKQVDTNPSGLNWAGINKYSANGNVFGANGIVPYAMGGIVNRPTLFPFANGGAIGTGLMGEAGPEAIMPLTRGANGKLGVMAAGGGTTNVVVNVDASGGSTTQGKDDNANQLGKVIAVAVQQELVRQRRPGGLLA